MADGELQVGARFANALRDWRPIKGLKSIGNNERDFSLTGVPQPYEHSSLQIVDGKVQLVEQPVRSSSSSSSSPIHAQSSAEAEVVSGDELGDDTGSDVGSEAGDDTSDESNMPLYHTEALTYDIKEPSFAIINRALAQFFWDAWIVDMVVVRTLGLPFINMLDLMQKQGADAGTWMATSRVGQIGWGIGSLATILVTLVAMAEGALQGFFLRTLTDFIKAAPDNLTALAQRLNPVAVDDEDDHVAVAKSWEAGFAWKKDAKWYNPTTWYEQLIDDSQAGKARKPGRPLMLFKLLAFNLFVRPFANVAREIALQTKAVDQMLLEEAGKGWWGSWLGKPGQEKHGLLADVTRLLLFVTQGIVYGAVKGAVEGVVGSIVVGLMAAYSAFRPSVWTGTWKALTSGDDVEELVVEGEIAESEDEAETDAPEAKDGFLKRFFWSEDYFDVGKKMGNSWMVEGRKARTQSPKETQDGQNGEEGYAGTNSVYAERVQQDYQDQHKESKLRFKYKASTTGGLYQVADGHDFNGLSREGANLGGFGGYIMVRKYFADRTLVMGITNIVMHPTYWLNLSADSYTAQGAEIGSKLGYVGYALSVVITTGANIVKRVFSNVVTVLSFGRMRPYQEKLSVGTEEDAKNVWEYRDGYIRTAQVGGPLTNITGAIGLVLGAVIIGLPAAAAYLVIEGVSQAWSGLWNRLPSFPRGKESTMSVKDAGSNANPKEGAVPADGAGPDMVIEEEGAEAAERAGADDMATVEVVELGGVGVLGDGEEGGEELVVEHPDGALGDANGDGDTPVVPMGTPLFGDDGTVGRPSSKSSDGKGDSRTLPATPPVDHLDQFGSLSGDGVSLPSEVATTAPQDDITGPDAVRVEVTKSSVGSTMSGNG